MSGKKWSFESTKCYRLPGSPVVGVHVFRIYCRKIYVSEATECSEGPPLHRYEDFRNTEKIKDLRRIDIFPTKPNKLDETVIINRHDHYQQNDLTTQQ